MGEINEVNAFVSAEACGSATVQHTMCYISRLVGQRQRSEADTYT